MSIIVDFGCWRSSWRLLFPKPPLYCAQSASPIVILGPVFAEVSLRIADTIPSRFSEAQCNTLVSASTPLIHDWLFIEVQAGFNISLPDFNTTCFDLFSYDSATNLSRNNVTLSLRFRAILE